MNTINVFFANLVAPLTLGILLDWLNNGEPATPQNYHHAINIVLVTSYLGGILSLKLLKEVYPKR